MSDDIWADWRDIEAAQHEADGQALAPARQERPATVRKHLRVVTDTPEPPPPVYESLGRVPALPDRPPPSTSAIRRLVAYLDAVLDTKEGRKP